MAQPEIQYSDSLRENTSRGPSNTIWHNCPVLSFIEDPGKGTHFFDDFETWTDGGSPWKTTKTTSTIVRLADETGGVIQHNNSITNDSGAVMVLGDDVGASYVITKDNGKKLWFECRLKVSSLATNAGNVFVGLCEESLATATTDIIAIGDTIVAVDHVGFAILAADPSGVDVVHGINGTASTQLIDNFDTVVADTYMKLGLYFDGKNTISFYLNGLKSATTVLANATNFPTGEELALYIVSTVGSGSIAYKAEFDWARVAMSESVGSF